MHSTLSKYWHIHWQQKIDSRSEIERLGQIYSELAASSNDKIDRSTFRDMLADQFGVDDSLIMDRGVYLILN